MKKPTVESNSDNNDYVLSHTLPQDIEKHIDDISKLDLETIISKKIRLYGKVRLVSIELNYFFIETIEYDNDFLRHDYYSDESKCENGIIPNNGTKVSFLLAKSGSAIYAYSVNIVIEKKGG